MKQLEDTSKEKSRALAVIHDDEGFDWSHILPEEDAVGYAFVATKEIKPFRDTRTAAEKSNDRQQRAQYKMMRISRVYSEAKKAKRWDADRECYLDPEGNIAIDPKTLSLEAFAEEFAELEESQQRKWWGGGEENEKEKEKEQELKPKKIDEGIIDTSQELNAENFMNMADKVLAAKKLEVDSKSESESKSQVSSIASTSESGKKVKDDSDYKNCMKNCKVCSTLAYLNGTKVNDLIKRVRKVEDQVLDRDKMLKFSNDQVKKLTEKIDNDKIEEERIRKQNEKLVHENRQLSENFNKLQQTIQDSDERNSKIRKENEHLTGVLRHKEEQINKQLDEIAKLKLQFEEAKIENERINLKLTSYNSASFVLQHIVPKPIGKNKAGEDVFSDGTGVGYHQVPPLVLNNYSKKQSELVNDEDDNEVKLPDTIDVTFTSSSDEDSVQTEVVKSMVENVQKSESDTTEEDECFLDKYIPKV
ncbi:hypothetical protein HanPI659440_Chr11g0422441 [Helianthus annuus]|nr:hypothetical protein HanPI659440_Chr11g0422441 [Helianthus annuus]